MAKQRIKRESKYAAKGKPYQYNPLIRQWERAIMHGGKDEADRLHEAFLKVLGIRKDARGMWVSGPVVHTGEIRGRE